MFRVDVFARNCFNDFWTGKKHIAGILHHQRKVGEGRRVNGTACTRTEYRWDLWNNARSQDITLEYLAITGQCADAFLYTGTARIVHTDHRSPHRHRHIHNFADLLRHRFRQRTAVYRKVLGVNIDQPAVDRSRAGHDSVAEILLFLHPEVVTTVEFKHIIFFKTSFVDKHINTFTSCVFAPFVLFLDGFLATTETSLLAFGDKFFDFLCLLTHKLIIGFFVTKYVQRYEEKLIMVERRPIFIAFYVYCQDWKSYVEKQKIATGKRGVVFRIAKSR